MYRRIPESGLGGRSDAISWISVDVDCSGASPIVGGGTAASCGIVVFDAGANVPLLTWTVSFLTPAGYVVDRVAVI